MIPIMKKPTAYLVLCRKDRKDDSEPGDYELATRREFTHEWQAQEYADGISSSREPVVVMVVGRRS